MRCSQCGRKMQASWNNGRAYYRCKFPAEYAIAEEQHPKTVYVQEHAIVPCLDEWIGSLFADDRLDVTCEALAAVSDLDPLDDDGREFDLRRRLKECDAKLARYRELLEVDSEITSAATWIAEVERERRSIERDLGRKPTSRKHTKNGIKTLVRQLKDIVGALANADPKDKRAIYDELGVSLTYHRDGRVHVAAGAHVLRDGVGGGTTPGTSWVLAQFCPGFAPSSDISRTAASHPWMVTSVSFGSLQCRSMSTQAVLPRSRMARQPFRLAHARRQVPLIVTARVQTCGHERRRVGGKPGCACGLTSHPQSIPSSSPPAPTRSSTLS
jgi:hypothetical protein